ncbi:MAG TPA: hypothetical protein PKI03_27955, partial [Pseudomonadota bacterium]|nr:hypothetical protein [Pseudomonadota bacterium]
VSDLDGASLTPQLTQVRPATFVDRLLAAAATLPAPVAEPLWQGDAAALVGALEAALLSHRDTAARTLADLLAEPEPLSPGAGGAGATRRAGLRLLPLGDGRSPLPTELSTQLGQGLLPTLRRLAMAQLPQSVAGQKPQLGGELDLSLRLQALQFIARLADLPPPTGSDGTLTREAQQVLQAVSGLENAELALSALELLCQPRAGSNPSQLAPVSESVLARFFGSRERSLRVAAMITATRLFTLDRRLVPAALLRRASQDEDGFIRDSASGLLRGR